MSAEAHAPGQEMPHPQLPGIRYKRTIPRRLFAPSVGLFAFVAMTVFSWVAWVKGKRIQIELKREKFQRRSYLFPLVQYEIDKRAYEQGGQMWNLIEKQGGEDGDGLGGGGRDKRPRPFMHSQWLSIPQINFTE